MDFVREKLGARFVFNNPKPDCRLRLRRKRLDHAGGGRPALNVAADPHRYDDLFAEFGSIVLRRFFGGEGIYAGATMIGSVFRDNDLFQDRRREPQTVRCGRVQALHLHEGQGPGDDDLARDSRPALRRSGRTRALGPCRPRGGAGFADGKEKGAQGIEARPGTGSSMSPPPPPF
ncbi:MAG: hypothetical protein WDM81_15345 [Rhizomicrobium sp.]